MGARSSRVGSDSQRGRRHLRGSARRSSSTLASRAGSAASIPRPSFSAAATGGATLVPGATADLVTIGVSSPRLAGTPVNALLDSLVFAATADDVTDVMVAGHEVVRDGAHISIDVAAELDRSVRAAWREAMTLVVDDIGLLVTNDPARGGGRLGLVQDAALVIDGRPRHRHRAGGCAGRRAHQR